MPYGKAWDGEDPHVTVLRLVSIRNKVLSAVHVDVCAGAIRSRKRNGAGVDTEDRICTGC